MCVICVTRHEVCVTDDLGLGVVLVELVALREAHVAVVAEREESLAVRSYRRATAAQAVARPTAAQSQSLACG